MAGDWQLVKPGPNWPGDWQNVLQGQAFGCTRRNREGQTLDPQGNVTTDINFATDVRPAQAKKNEFIARVTVNGEHPEMAAYNMGMVDYNKEVNPQNPNQFWLIVRLTQRTGVRMSILWDETPVDYSDPPHMSNNYQPQPRSESCREFMCVKGFVSGHTRNEADYVPKWQIWDTRITCRRFLDQDGNMAQAISEERFRNLAGQWLGGGGA